MNLMFRDLRADEIDCRVGTVSKEGKGLSLLLYKDARCDMNILDETVGPMNWQRAHSRDNANCVVSVRNPETGEWVSKEDTGTESNTEALKGLASDSFKRSCTNWGIGRELYTAPFIWIEPSKGSKTDRYSVAEIVIENKKITGLSILNEKTGAIVYTFGKVKASKPAKTTKAKAQAPVAVPAAPTAPVQPVADQPEVVETIICHRCTEPVKGVKLKGGGTMTPAQVVAYGQKAFPDWDQLCAKCQGELMKSRNQGGNQ